MEIPTCVLASVVVHLSRWLLIEVAAERPRPEERADEGFELFVLVRGDSSVASVGGGGGGCKNCI